MAEKVPATFIASIRVNIKDIASLALFYNSIDKHLGTSSKLVSEVIRNSANLLRDNFKVETITEAVKILTDLNYNDAMRKNARHHKALLAALSLESQTEIKHENYMQVIKEQMSSNDTIELTKKENADIKNLRNEMKGVLNV